MGPQLIAVGDTGHMGVMAQVFQCPYICVCVCVCENVYYSRSKGQKKEGMKDGGEDNLRLRA
jgi:hypothetical protein